MKCWYLINTICDRPPGICEGCQKYEDWRKESERMNRGEGYCPHNGMGYFTCPNCGCGEWVSYPQSVPTDRSKTWTYEYHCARCGKMMGLTRKGDE